MEEADESEEYENEFLHNKPNLFKIDPNGSEKINIGNESQSVVDLDKSYVATATEGDVFDQE